MAGSSKFASKNLIGFQFHLTPKVELHAHLSGSLSDDVVFQLLQRKYEQNSHNTPRLLSSLKIGNEKSLDESMKIFKAIHLLMDNIEAIKDTTYLVIKEFCDDNVKYLELRTTPKLVEETSSKKKYLEAVLESISKAERTLEITVRLLVSIDRSRGVSDAWDSLRITEELLTHDVYGRYICGMDVSGDPNVGSLLDYIPVLVKAKELGLKLAVHLYEVNTPTAFEEAEALISRELVDRIGHGTFLHHLNDGSKAMADVVKEKKIPIEVCITSNIKCGSAIDLEHHHVNIWQKENHPIAICTDDKGVFSTTLSKELELYAQTTNASLEDLHAMTLASLQFSFLEEKAKKTLYKKMKEEMNRPT